MINNEIKADKVKLVQDTGGVIEISLKEAIEIAEKTDEDVILIGNQKDLIPVVKIGDYNKYIYNKQKREKENKKKLRQSKQELKEIQISTVIAEHDLKIKANNIDRLLKEGNKVKIVIRYLGRSKRFIQEGPCKLQNLVNLLQQKYKIDAIPKIDGNRVYMIVSPIKNKGDKKE